MISVGIMIIVIILIQITSSVIIPYIQNTKENKQEVIEIYNSLINLKAGDLYKISDKLYIVKNVSITKEKNKLLTLYTDYKITLEKDNDVISVLVRSHTIVIPPYPYICIEFSQLVQNIPFNINLYWAGKNYMVNNKRTNVEKRITLYNILASILSDGVDKTYYKLKGLNDKFEKAVI